jgi:hypothetical protein
MILPGYKARAATRCVHGGRFEHVFQGRGGRGRRDGMTDGATATVDCQESERADDKSE